MLPDLSNPGFLVMLIGAPDTGKSTLARRIYQDLCRRYACVGFLDGDPGQSTLGPPTTMTLALNRRGEKVFPPQGRFRRRFVGATSPRGHMLPMLVNAQRLLQAAREHGAEVVVYDTCGLVSPQDGGYALKLAKIELLRPSLLIVIQRAGELESLLEGLHQHPLRLIRLTPAAQVQLRLPEQRRAYRQQRFAVYFQAAQSLTLSLSSLAVIAFSPLRLGQLVSLEDRYGFVRALGILQEINLASGALTLLTPLRNTEHIQILRAGDLLLDPLTFQEQRIMLE